MIHLFKSAAARTFTYSLMAVVALGLLIGAVRLALPFADLFRTQIANALGETLGLEVQMGRFRLRLAGMVPRVTLEDVDLLDPDSGEPQLQLMRLHLNLDLTASIKELAPQVESLTMEGARLQVVRRTDGTIAIAGLDGAEAGDPRTMHFFLANGRFLLTDSHAVFLDELTGAAPIKLTDVQIRFDNDASRHRIGLRARLSEEPDTHLHLAADLHGEPHAPTDWSGNLYLDWQGTDLPTLLQRQLPAGIRLHSDQHRVRVWNRIAGSRIVHALGLVALEGLETQNGRENDDVTRLRAQRLDALLRWLPEDDGWRVEVSDLTVAWTPAHHSIADLGMRYRADSSGGWTITAGTEGFALADLREFLPLSPALSPLLDKLRRAEPAGDIRGLRLKLEREQGGSLRWAISGQLIGLQLAAMEPVPGLSRLDLRFLARTDGGRLDIDGEDLSLELPWLFGDRGPLLFEQLSGSLSWERSANGGLHLESDGLALDNTDFNSHTRFTLNLPSSQQGPSLDIYSEIRNLKATSIGHYLPVARLKPKLHNWLEQAFLDGDIPWASIHFQGRPADFPFRNGEGRLAAAIRTEDLDLRFHRDWPPLESVDSIVRIENTRLGIDVSGGVIQDLSVLEAQGEIPDLADAAAIRVNGITLGAFAKGIDFLRKTPIKRRLGTLADLFRADGACRVDLSMSVPLRKRGPEDRLKLAGALSWPGPATLALSKVDFELNALSGALNFDQTGITRSHLAGELWGTPLSAEIDSAHDAASGTSQTQITLSSTTSVKTLAQHLPSPLWQHLRGKSPWTLDLTVPNHRLDQPSIPLDFALTSDLRGMALGLPTPLEKHPAESQHLQLKGSLHPGVETRIHGHYANLVFNLLFSTDAKGSRRFRRGGLAFGSTEAPLPESEGLHLSGRLVEIDLPAWTRLAKDSAKGSSGTGLLRSADLRLDRLLLPAVILRDVHLELEWNTTSWEAQIESSELAGRVTVPHRPRSRPLQIALDRLDLEPLLTDWETGSTKKDSPGDPQRSHSLDISVEQLRWGANNLGRFSLSAEARDDGLAFNEIHLDTKPLMQVSGSGRWSVDEQGQSSQIDLKAEGKDLGEFLRHFGYESLLHEAPASAALHLGWPGGPGDFSLATLMGSAQAEIGAGSLLDVDPGIGRMLGILNLDALKRRLSLDFSDLFERGYAFERMVGKLDISAGQADIAEMYIEGPSAEIHIEGKTDLIKQEFAQIVTVTPDLGSSVALASAVAGGPLVGAAVLIADKVSGGAVDKIGRYQYDVTGPWSSPQIKRRSLARHDADAQVFLPDQSRVGAQRESKERPPKSSVEHRVDEISATHRKSEPKPNLFLDQP